MYRYEFGFGIIFNGTMLNLGNFVLILYITNPSWSNNHMPRLTNGVFVTKIKHFNKSIRNSNRIYDERYLIMVQTTKITLSRFTFGLHNLLTHYV